MKALWAVFGHDFAIRALVVTHAQSTGSVRQELLGLLISHSREVVDIVPALGAMTNLVVTLHLFPIRRARCGNSHLIQESQFFSHREQ